MNTLFRLFAVFKLHRKGYLVWRTLFKLEHYFCTVSMKFIDLRKTIDDVCGFRKVTFGKCTVFWVEH